MASPIKDQQHLPDYAKPTAVRIERLGFKWEFDYEYPIPDPDKTQRLQVRDVKHIASTSDVNVYAAAMKRGDKFPPGVVTRDGRFVDFNTRAKAAHKLSWPHFPVFILNVDYGNATESERDRLQLLGASFNTTHGKRLDRNELAMNIRYVAGNPDWTAERVATLLGITHGTVKVIFAQFKAEKRAKDLGVSFNGSVTASNRTMLGQRSEKLTDRPFREIAKLAQDAGLTGPELSDLCNRVQKVTGSDDEKVAVVDAEREARGAQIAHFTATGRKKPPLTSELIKRTRYIEGLAGKLNELAELNELVDHNPDTAQSYLDSVETAARILSAIVEAQRDAMGTVEETVS